MIKTSDAFNDAFAAPGRELRARVTIGKNVYDSNDLTSISYDSGAMTGDQFSIGSTYMNSTKITFSHLIEGLKQLDEVLVEFGIVKADGSTEYVKMGTFIVDEKIQMDRNNNSTTIECMDRMVMLGGIYKSKLTYPADIQEVAVEIANMSGVKANETSLARLPKQKINEPIGYSYRDAIGLIAQFAIGFALFDRNGFLDIRSLVDDEFKIDPSQYFLKGLVKNETFFKLNGISCTVVTTSTDENGNETSKTTVLQSGSASGSQIKLANNVMTQDILDQMYEAIKYTNYYPFTLNWNGNPAVEAGDWLTLEDIQGNEFKVPNMSYTLTYNGGLTASSKAETSTNSSVTYSYGGSISNSVVEIGGREGAEGNHIYEGTEDDEPLYPKEGDLWYKHVGPDTEEWIYTDGEWKFITSTKPANDAKKAADEAKKEAEEATKNANDAVSKANDAVASAGFAKGTADNAKSDAAGALSKANDAYTNAGNALTESSQAKKDSAGALSKSADALTNSGKAIEDAKNALSDVSKLDQTVKTEISNINGQLSQKVSQDIFDQLKGTVTSQGTEIDQNKNEIALKADQNTVDTLSGKVSSNSAAININSNNIALKANKTDVDKVAGSVSELDAELKIQADQISSKVTRNDVTGMLGPYATQTWAQSQINQTANEIKLGVNKVQGELDNLTTGARNLIQNSGNFQNTNHWTSTGSLTLQKHSFWKNNTENMMVLHATTSAETNLSSIRFPLEKGVEYTVQFDGFHNSALSSIDVWVLGRKYGSVADFDTTMRIKSEFTLKASGVTHTSIKFTAPVDMDEAYLRFDNNGTKIAGQTAELWITDIKLAKENKPSSWAPAPEDLATAEQYTELDAELKIQAGQISLKANQKDVDVVKKTVTDNTSRIDVNTKSIALKANQTTVDQINGTVKQLDAELKVQAGQITSKVSRSDVTGMLSGYATQSWTQSQINQTADSINISVSNVQNNLDNLTTGARNIIQNSGNFQNTNHWTSTGSLTLQKHSFWKNNTENMMVLHATTSAETNLSSTRFPLEAGKVYSVQFDGFQSVDVSSIDVYILGRKYGSTSDFDKAMLIKGQFLLTASKVVHTNIKFTTPEGMDEAYLRFDNNGTKTSGKTAELWITDIKVAQENNPSPWAPAPEDYATVDKLSELQVTVNGIQGTVQNKADKSQVTQLADQITSVVGSMGSDNLIVDGSFHNSKINEYPLWWEKSKSGYVSVVVNENWSNDVVRPDANVLKIKGTSTGNMDVFGPVFTVTPGDEFYSEFKVRWQSTSLKGDVVIGLVIYDKTNKQLGGYVGARSTTPSNWVIEKGKIVVPENAAYAKAWVSYRSAQLDSNTSYVTITDLIIRRDSATQSQITQLEDNINLRVQKNDVVNQINVSSEGILISGNKIHITGQTSIDSAVIKSAMIADISADKITAGTINAANVNLINMNASNITTGTIKGASLSINLLNGNVTFQKGRIYSTTGTIDMNIDQGYLSVTNAAGNNKNNVLIRDGEIAFTQPGLFDPSKDPYLRITNSVLESSFGSSTIQARGALEMNIKGHESSLVNVGEEKFAGIKLGMGNSNKLEPTYIGGANVGVIISGGASTSGMMSMSPHIYVGNTGTGGQANNEIHIDSEWIRLTAAANQTTSEGSNVYIKGDGTLMRSTSASKYKQNIIRNVDLSDSEKLLNIPLARWDDKAEVRRTGTSKRYFGMIAEDLAAAGLEYLVDRGPNGEIEGIEYSKVALLLIPEVKKLRNKIEMLEQQNGGNIA
ncbi:hypothetical protein PAF15_01240 [Weissella koreensis]|uniref:hypothetical protein n=1 Tax=Weissella koreensis TaxID=165096 RepID=UPI0022BA66D3|nr:hypothetical protein [Weissella koreensis]MCZ9310601.1 hypothetical protein [Weissella koreensis]